VLLQQALSPAASHRPAQTHSVYAKHTCVGVHTVNIWCCTTGLAGPLTCSVSSSRTYPRWYVSCAGSSVAACSSSTRPARRMGTTYGNSRGMQHVHTLSAANHYATPVTCHMLSVPAATGVAFPTRFLGGVFVTREHVRHNKSGIAHRGRTGINHLRELPTKLNHFCSGGQVTLPNRTREPQVCLWSAGCREFGGGSQ
jgi:hypothetical protein